MGWFQNLFGGGSVTSLDLKRDPAIESAGRSKVGLPRVPWPELTSESLARFTRRSEIVYACIEKKAQAACDPELMVEKRNGTGEWEKVDGHPAVALLRKPNPYEDGESFLRAWMASENTAGIFYAEKIVANGGGLAELYPLIPTQMSYQTKSSGEVDYYEYHFNGTGSPVKFKPEELLIRRRHSLGSVFSGLSPLQVALGSVDADIAATEYVRAFFNNDGTPSGILKVKDRRLSDEQAQHLQQRWKTNYSRHGKNRGGVAVLDEAADYETIGARLNELNSDSLTGIDESRICMAFGVPPILIGAYVGLLHVNQRASVKEAQEDFWMNTMSPELKQIRHWLTWFILPYFENYETIVAGDIRFNWDMAQVDALQEDLDDIHKRTREDYKYGLLTLNEARESIKLEPVEGEEGDAFYKPTPTMQQPEDEEEEGQDPLKGLVLRIGPGKQDVLSHANGNGSKKNFELDGLTLSREPNEYESAINLKAIHQSYEEGAEALFKVIQTIRGDLIVQATVAVKDFGTDDIATLSLTPPAYAERSVTKVVKGSVIEGQNQILIQARQGVVDYRKWATFYKGAVDDLIRKLVELTIARVITEVSTAAINIFTSLGVLGLDREEIEQRMREELETRSDAPFLRIATQTTNKAVNEGRAEEMRARDDEIEKYIYSAILDANVCEHCEVWDGAEADSLGQLPDTPNPECSGGASCRCMIVTVFTGEAQT